MSPWSAYRWLYNEYPWRGCEAYKGHLSAPHRATMSFSTWKNKNVNDTKSFRRRLFGWVHPFWAKWWIKFHRGCHMKPLSGEWWKSNKYRSVFTDEDGGRYSAHFVQRGGYAFTFSCHAALSTVEDASADDSSVIGGNKVTYCCCIVLQIFGMGSTMSAN